MPRKNYFDRLRERYIFYTILGIISLVLIIILTRCGNAPESASGKAENEYDLIPYKLATIDAGEPIVKSDHNIIKYEKLLNRLSLKYVEDKLKIANLIVAAQGILKEEGITVSLFQIMEGMDQIISQSSEINKLQQILAMYCDLRKAGDSHEDTILNLRAFLKTIGVK